MTISGFFAACTEYRQDIDEVLACHHLPTGLNGPAHLASQTGSTAPGIPCLSTEQKDIAVAIYAQQDSAAQICFRFRQR